jgi:hypothetical protein
MLISPSEFSGTDPVEIFKVIGAYTLFMLPFVGIAGVFVGLPVAIALRHLGLVGLPFFLVGGAVTGAAFSALVLGGIAMEKTGFVFLWAASIGVVPGVIAAFIWWRLVERPTIVASNV